ncbi:metalloregulatory protein (zinc-responsiveness transcriptional activator) [Colletotrichum tofieldiae]|uniref:Metalloregulatory protein (Zinc-responsiveness transcriptional activator) n=1 Tax=Colletotrichum tofieldiae TaxID=708197 RepID=A0A166RD38_9PEZI|nr:metalloregulatory protein (zinc-responsiveness transcriptional activator) [Colletotrichum tofieldiae]
MDDHQDGFSTAFDPNQSLFNMPYSTMVPDHDHDHFLGGTLSISHDESCLDLKYDHVACRGPENNHQHHPVPNHNHPRINLNSIPMLQRRHHSISTMPGIPNFFESKDQSPVGFGANALMSPTAHVDFAAMIHTDSSTNVEDDSTSAACSSLDCNQCASDCGASEAGDICRDAECGPACDDDECERAASPCEDAECLARSLSEKDKAAAGVLASFGGENSLCQNGMATSSMPSLQTSQFFSNQSSFDNGVMTAASQSSFHNGGLPSTMVQPMNMDGFYQCDLDSLPATYMDASMDGNFDWASWAAHIANEHSSGACVRPCLMEQNLPFDNTKCPMPHQVYAHPGQEYFCVPSDQANFVACGAEFNNTTDLIQHIFTQHQHQHAEGEHLDFFPEAHPPTLPLMASQHQHTHHHPQSPSTIQVSTKVLRNRESSTNSSISRPLTASSPVVSPNTILSEASSITSEQFACKWHKEVGGQVCGLVFQDDEGLQNHCREQHLKNLNKTENGFKCRWEGCSRDGHFTQKSKLERHLQTHTGYKPVKCTICGLALSAKQSLAQHMRIHTGEKPWACQHPGCDAAFKQQSALTMHMRTHTGEKPLSCDVCGKAFGESSNLSKHRKTHNVKGAFKCDFCDKDFHRLDQKRRHEKTHRTKENGGTAVDIETSQSIRKTQGGRVTKNTK